MDFNSRVIRRDASRNQPVVTYSRKYDVGGRFKGQNMGEDEQIVKVYRT